MAYWDGQYWQTATFENFETAGSYAQETPLYGASGNLTWDGLYSYTYDAWNRLASVKRGYRDSYGYLSLTSAVAIMKYDGLDRRISKTITHSGDWDGTYHYYLDGPNVVQIRNGSAQVIKRLFWGTQSPDELVRVGTWNSSQESWNEEKGDKKKKKKGTPITVRVKGAPPLFP